MMVQIFLLFMVCLSPINDVLSTLQHFLLVPTPGLVIKQRFCCYIIACLVGRQAIT